MDEEQKDEGTAETPAAVSEGASAPAEPAASETPAEAPVEEGVAT